MPFQALLKKRYDENFKNIFFDLLVEKLSYNFQNSKELVVLIGNISDKIKDIDAILLKNDAIIIIEFKDFDVETNFNLKGSLNANNATIIDETFTNSVVKLEASKRGLYNFLNNFKDKIFENQHKKIDYEFIFLMILFQKRIQTQNVVKNKLDKNFFIADIEKIEELSKNIFSKNLDLTNNEIKNLIKLFGLIDEYAINSRFKINTDIKLTDEQLEILKLKKGKYVVLAPPGAGKTTLLALRVSYALSNGIKGDKMISLTFTNRAARNMDWKINEFIQNEEVFIGSFHKYGFMFLKENKLINDNSSILDEFEIETLINEALEEARNEQIDQDHDIADNKLLLLYYNYMIQKENNLFDTLCSESYNKFLKRYEKSNTRSQFNLVLSSPPSIESIEKFLEKFYYKYKKLKEELNAIDYDDILNLTLAGLKKDDIKRLKDYEWIQVDEAQDLNTLQWYIIENLSAKNSHFVLFADPYQAIFGFMGSSTELLEQKIQYLDKKFLTVNFRSPEYLIKFYNKYIRTNFKKIYYYFEPFNTFNKQNGNEDDFYYTYVPNSNQEDEIHNILQNILPNIENNCAILLRNNEEVDKYSFYLKNYGFPHFKVSKNDIFNKDDIKLLLSIIGVMVNPKNKIYWMRIFSLFLGMDLKNSRILTLNIFKTINSNPFHLFKKDFEFSKHSKLIEYKNEIENFKEKFKPFLKYFLDNYRKKNQLGNVIIDIGNILNNLNLISDPDFDEDIEKIVKYMNNKCKIGTLQQVVINDFKHLIHLKETDLILEDEKIVVSTIHKAKSLEWDTVIIPQVTETNFSSKYNKTDNSNEEDARLLFVALTRAKKQLILSYHTLNKFGKPQNISPFLKNIIDEVPLKKFEIKQTEIVETKKQIKDNSIKKPTLIASFDKLYNMIGLHKAKEQITDVINLAQFIREREKKGLKTKKGTLHLVFAGNPGTGKTSVARLVGEIYKEIGILSKGHLIETDRSDLVGEYIGHTEQKTKNKIKEALGGVLFIDEAYSLNNPSSNDFGKEAIEILLKMMEDYRDDLIVIVAGYIEKMQDFINSNPGLQSRFSNVIIFEDYSNNELLEILINFAQEEFFTLTENAKLKAFDVISVAKNNGKITGNARTIRNFFDKIKINTAKRISQINNPSKSNLIEIQDLDIPDEI